MQADDGTFLSLSNDSWHKLEIMAVGGELLTKAMTLTKIENALGRIVYVDYGINGTAAIKNIYSTLSARMGENRKDIYDWELVMANESSKDRLAELLRGNTMLEAAWVTVCYEKVLKALYETVQTADFEDVPIIIDAANSAIEGHKEAKRGMLFNG